jgi:hypothetical protein
VRLENSQEVLYRSLDKYKAAVAQLAGVTTSRVAVLSFLTDAPATSLIGKRRRLAAADSSSEGSSMQQQPQVEVAWTQVEQQQQGELVLLSDGSFAAHPYAGSSSSSSSSGFLRQLLLEALRSGQLEVYSRIATQNAADAAAITGRINNATRQAKFEKDLADAGLKLIQGSITVRSMDASGSGGPGSGWGLPGVNISDPNTRRILIIVAASVAAGVFVMLLGWAISCCLRKRRRGVQQHAARPGHPHPSQQQFLTSGYGYYNSPGNTPSSSGHSSVNGGRLPPQQPQQQQQPPSSWVRPLFGGSSGGGAAAQQGSNGRPLVNPFAGTAVQFAGGRGGAGGGSNGISSPYAPQPGGGHYYSPPPPAAVGSGYTVQGQTFRTLQEAEEFQLALALQRSLQQQGPPAHFLPHGSISGGPGSERLQQQQQQQGPTGYPVVGYGHR